MSNDLHEADEAADRVFLAAATDEPGQFRFEEYTGRDLPDGAVWDNWGQVYEETFDLYRLPGQDAFGLTAAWHMMLDDLAAEEYGDEEEGG